MDRRDCLYPVSVIVRQIIWFTGTDFYSPVIFRVSGVLHNADHRILSRITLFSFASVRTISSIFTVCSIHAILAIGAIRSIHTIFTIGAVLSIFTIRTIGTIYAIFAVRTIYTILAVRTVNTVFAGISIGTRISLLSVTNSDRGTSGKGDGISRTIRQLLNVSDVVSYLVNIDNHLKIINIFIQFSA